MSKKKINLCSFYKNTSNFISSHAVLILIAILSIVGFLIYIVFSSSINQKTMHGKRTIQSFAEDNQDNKTRFESSLLSFSRMPAEYEKTRTLWISANGNSIEQSEFYKSIIREARDIVPVAILTNTDNVSTVRMNLNNTNIGLAGIKIITSPYVMNSLWSRDFMGIEVYEKTTAGYYKHLLYDPVYQSHNEGSGADNAPLYVSEEIAAERTTLDFEFEGGNLDNDSRGRCITVTPYYGEYTEGTTDNRLKDAIERKNEILRNKFACKEIYHAEALSGIEAIAHIDLYAKFIGDNHILVAEDTKKNIDLRGRLENFVSTLQSEGVKVSRLSLPPLLESGGGKAYYRSYINSTIINAEPRGKKVLIPQFGIEQDDEFAKRSYQQLFPEYEIVQIYISEGLVKANGYVHCATWNESAIRSISEEYNQSVEPTNNQRQEDREDTQSDENPDQTGDVCSLAESGLNKRYTPQCERQGYFPREGCDDWCIEGYSDCLYEEGGGEYVACQENTKCEFEDTDLPLGSKPYCSEGEKFWARKGCADTCTGSTVDCKYRVQGILYAGCMLSSGGGTGPQSDEPGGDLTTDGGGDTVACYTREFCQSIGAANKCGKDDTGSCSRNKRSICVTEEGTPFITEEADERREGERCEGAREGSGGREDEGGGEQTGGGDWTVYWDQECVCTDGETYKSLRDEPGYTSIRKSDPGEERDRCNSSPGEYIDICMGMGGFKNGAVKTYWDEECVCTDNREYKSIYRMGEGDAGQCTMEQQSYRCP
jgi:agmatine/peptidylarginine deiminase